MKDKDLREMVSKVAGYFQAESDFEEFTKALRRQFWESRLEGEPGDCPGCENHQAGGNGSAMRNLRQQIAGFILGALSIGLLSACGDNSDVPLTQPVVADRVLTGGSIYTVNPAQPWAEAVAIKGDTLIYVGDAAGVQAHIDSDTQVADLDGRMVLPGFVDTHAHPLQSAGMVYALQLDSSMNLAEIQDAVASYAESNPERELVLGFGYGEFQFGPEGPTKAMLDAVVTDRPVLLIDEGAHTAWANTRALEVFGIDGSTPDPIPGKHLPTRCRGQSHGLHGGVADVFPAAGGVWRV